MAHWQAVDGTRVLGAGDQPAGQHPAPGDRGRTIPFPASMRAMDWETASALQGWFYATRWGRLPPAGQPRPAAGRVPLRPPGAARPLPRRALVGAGRLAPSLRPADPAVGAGTAGELRMLTRADHPAVAAGSGQVAPGHPAGGRRAALDDRQPGTAASACAASTDWLTSRLRRPRATSSATPPQPPSRPPRSAAGTPTRPTG